MYFFCTMINRAFYISPYFANVMLQFSNGYFEVVLRIFFSIFVIRVGSQYCYHLSQGSTLNLWLKAMSSKQCCTLSVKLSKGLVAEMPYMLHIVNRPLNMIISTNPAAEWMIIDHIHFTICCILLWISLLSLTLSCYQEIYHSETQLYNCWGAEIYIYFVWIL